MAKKAVLLSFRLKDMNLQSGGPQNSSWWDKVDNKFLNWTKVEWEKAGFRAVPNCIVRNSAYIAPGVVLMPSFVNLGAYVDEGTMVDTWATVGSCAQIGKNVHLSGGVGIGVFSTLFMIFMYFLELLVAFLQAYVFTLLAAIYFSEATQEPHH